MVSDVTVVWSGLQDGWFRAVNDFAGATPWLHEPARLFANDGVVLFGALLLLSWWRARSTGDLRRVAASLWAPIGVLLAVAVNQPVAGAIGEARPYAALPHVLTLVHRSTDPSFPSDHSVMAGAVAAGILLVHRRLGLVAVALAVLMAATRVYVGAHFPLDVVAGLALGAVVAVVSWLAVAPLATRAVTALAQTRVRPLLAA